MPGPTRSFPILIQSFTPVGQCSRPSFPSTCWGVPGTHADPLYTSLFSPICILLQIRIYSPCRSQVPRSGTHVLPSRHLSSTFQTRWSLAPSPCLSILILAKRAAYAQAPNSGVFFSFHPPIGPARCSSKVPVFILPGATLAPSPCLSQLGTPHQNTTHWVAHTTDVHFLRFWGLERQDQGVS